LLHGDALLKKLLPLRVGVGLHGHNEEVSISISLRVARPGGYSGGAKPGPMAGELREKG
jgi:hypothetical protein